MIESVLFKGFSDVEKNHRHYANETQKDSDQQKWYKQEVGNDFVNCHTIKEPVFIFSIKIDHGLMGYVAKPYSSLV
ncbi:MAG: hypothetical protein AN484_25120 [Aphanizomenon flos-aquae WA102]|uniref:Uncharacterized protein n=1 Tax=Aphanizomenon flos-aquae WA102 TaxID=1710896 RepID=A0A1B7WJD2_APHFL|nr:MAG: hypothetical protein AN484_25120 [Aphanizomenon flos-aquae WA102]